MKRSGWARTDRLMRWLHLYTGLFLAPWMLVYGTSAFCLNHNRWIQERFGIEPPRWQRLRELPLASADLPAGRPAEQAEAVLRRVGLAGPYRIVGQPNRNRMVVLRVCGAGNYRITWHRNPSRIVVEQQRPFSAYRLLHFLHFRAGYGQPYCAMVAWAVTVDAVTVSIWLWVVSGIYLWARRPAKRTWGGICLGMGCLAFLVLVVLLCT